MGPVGLTHYANLGKAFEIVPPSAEEIAPADQLPSGERGGAPCTFRLLGGIEASLFSVTASAEDCDPFLVIETERLDEPSKNEPAV